MIRSLFNLTQKINSHITNLQPTKEFDLREVKPYLEKYIGNDWYDYKVKHSPLVTTECINNYMIFINCILHVLKIHIFYMCMCCK